MSKFLLILQIMVLMFLIAMIFVVALFYPSLVKLFSCFALGFLMIALFLFSIGFNKEYKYLRKAAIDILLICGMLFIGYLIACLNTGTWIRLW